MPFINHFLKLNFFFFINFEVTALYVRYDAPLWYVSFLISCCSLLALCFMKHVCYSLLVSYRSVVYRDECFVDIFVNYYSLSLKEYFLLNERNIRLNIIRHRNSGNSLFESLTLTQRYLQDT